MKKLLLILSLLLVGCASIEERKSELLSESVYATKDSIEKNRYELAKEWIGKVAQLVPAPKSRIKIESAKIKDRDIVILPKGTDAKNILVVDSVEYNNALEENSTLRNLVKYNKIILEDKEEQIEKLKKDIAEEKEYNKPWNVFKRWITGFGILGTLGGIGLIALFFFNPALFATVVKILGSVMEIVMRVVRAIIDWVKFIIAKIQDWNNKNE